MAKSNEYSFEKITQLLNNPGTGSSSLILTADCGIPLLRCAYPGLRNNGVVLEKCPGYGTVASGHFDDIQENENSYE